MACKISVTLRFELDEKWNDFFIISELMLGTLIHLWINVSNINSETG